MALVTETEVDDMLITLVFAVAFWCVRKVEPNEAFVKTKEKLDAEPPVKLSHSLAPSMQFRSEMVLFISFSFCLHIN